MLTGVSICPHPPLLVPAVSTGASEEIADLRAACLASVRRLLDQSTSQGTPECVVCIGPARSSDEWDERAGGSLQELGVDARFGGASVVLPESLTVAAFLLDQAGWAGRRRYVSLAADRAPDACAELGKELLNTKGSLALLVMGDGSAKRSVAAPGYLDERAAEFDRRAVAALASLDADGLLAVEPGLAEELWVEGRPTWQVLAGVAHGLRDHVKGAPVTTAVQYDEAPYGVGYFVIDWVVDWSVSQANEWP
ncbi:MAG: class III extradiol dioxygenase subunit B-like domain-containing protein [Nocardioidaceae bacterium]